MPTPTEQIDARIASLTDWRGPALSRIRALIHKAIPAAEEEWKWRGVPVWSHHGILCTGETYKDKIKLTFAQGAHLPDPASLFNSSLDGNQRRAIDLHEHTPLNEPALTALLQAASTFNQQRKTRKPAKAK